MRSAVLGLGTCIDGYIARTMRGGEIAREFLKADLVDELYAGIVPVLLGGRR